MDDIFGTEAASHLPTRTDEEIYNLNEVLFKSTNKELTADYVAWWDKAFTATLALYKMAELDGSPDSLRLRMIAAARLAQLCAAGMNFFGSAVEVIQEGEADGQVIEAVARVTTMAVENKVEGWLRSAQSNLN